MALRILVADDHAVLRRSLVRALQHEEGVEIVGEAGDGGMAVELAKALNPDIVIMDIVMPLINGIDATRQIVHDCPHTQIIALSVYASRSYATGMLKAGASAYVLKSGDLDELIHAVNVVSHGETYVSPEVPGADRRQTPATD